MDDADVVESAVLDRVEDRHHPGRVHLDADHVEVRLGRGHLDRRLAVPEPDVEHHVTRRIGLPVEHLDPVEQGTFDVEAPSFDPLVELRLTFR